MGEMSGEVLAIDLAAVSKTYVSKGIPALSNVTLRIPTGTTTAVMGPSGSGKSTLLNIIGGLDAPTSGRVMVDGTDLTDLSEAERSIWRRTAIGFVFQAYHLLPTLTASENVALPLHVQGRRRDVQSLVTRALTDVGLADRATHLPDQLSGGERQRVAIARALAVNPRLILADEPTGNLDSESGRAILELLLESARARNATLVLVTHNEQAAARCDRMVKLSDGRVVTEGSA